MWHFTADLHFDHDEILKLCNRPYKRIEDMNQDLINEWNTYVAPADVVVVVGDYAWPHSQAIVKDKFTSNLVGNKIFIKGDHDRWMPNSEKRHIYRRLIDNQYIVCCHWSFRTWSRSVHGSWNLHGHSHGNLAPFANQLDVGVDSAYRLLGAYRPFSMEDIKEIFKLRKLNYDLGG